MPNGKARPKSPNRRAVPSKPKTELTLDRAKSVYLTTAKMPRINTRHSIIHALDADFVFARMARFVSLSVASVI